LGFSVFRVFLGFNLQIPNTKLPIHKQRFGQVNATNRCSYLSIILYQISYKSEEKTGKKS